MVDQSTESSKESFNSVAIIGSGPAGLFAASMCSTLGLNPIVIEALPHAGGQCSVLYPEKHVQGIPALKDIKSQDFVNLLYNQALSYQVRFCFDARIDQIEEKIEKNGVFFKLSSKNNVFYARAVIIAAGVGSFDPNRPTLEKLEEFENISVHYHVSNWAPFQGARTVIAGGGDAAINWASELIPHAKSVSVIHRREQFRCMPANEIHLKKLQEQGLLQVYTPYQIVKLNGQNGKLSSIIIQNTERMEKEIPVDQLLFLFGLSVNLGPIRHWNLAFKGPKILIDPSTCATSRPGIFAIGDAVSYDHKINLITCAFGEAIKAAYAAKQLINPDEILQPNCQAFTHPQ